MKYLVALAVLLAIVVLAYVYGGSLWALCAAVGGGALSTFMRPRPTVQAAKQAEARANAIAKADFDKAVEKIDARTADATKDDASLDADIARRFGRKP